MRVFKGSFIVSVLFVSLLSMIASAQKAPVVADTPMVVANSDAQKIIQRLKQSRPDLVFESVKPTPASELYEVTLQGGNTLYATANGEYFIVGELYQARPGGFVNLSEQKRSKERAVLLADIDRKSLISFSPKGEKKSEVYVFTDIECGYCRLLHQEVARMNELGIEVNYLAYPRAGLDSDVYTRMVSAWCSSDPQQAMTDQKSGKKITPASCKDNPVQAHYMLGGRMGVQGTPAIFLADGTLIPGYRKADDLATLLGLK